MSEEAAPITEDSETTPVHAAWTPEGETPPPAPAVAERVDEEKVIEMLKTVFDPEIPVDIYELGLIYAVEIADDGNVKVEMTLTTPSCPSAQELPGQVEEAGGDLLRPGIGAVVQAQDVVPLAQEGQAEVGADLPARPGDQHSHVATLLLFLDWVPA